MVKFERGDFGKKLLLVNSEYPNKTYKVIFNTYCISIDGHFIYNILIDTRNY